MYYKIQPEQIQIHDFSSPSGDLNFSIGSNYIYANLSRKLTGDFNLTGSISINGIKIQSSDPSNFVSGDNSFIFGGTSNQVTGTKNLSLNSNSSTIAGTNNSIINSSFSSISDNSFSNTIIGGRSASILANTTGSMILKDSVASLEEVSLSDSLNISFRSGTFIKNGGLNIQNGDLIVNNSNLKLGSAGSGLFSGDLNVLGFSYFSNRPKVNGVEVALVGEGGGGGGVGTVDTTSNQTIGGLKNFTTRPTVSGSGVLLVGEVGGGVGEVTLGTAQTFTAAKTFQTASNQLALRTGVAGNKIDITAPTIEANRTYTLPDVGADAQFLMSDGNQTIGGLKNFNIRPQVAGVSVALVGEGGAGAGEVTLGTTQTFTGQKTFQSGLVVEKASNQLTFRTGTAGNRIDISSPTIAGNRTYTLPDVGVKSEFVMSSGNQSIAGSKTFSVNQIFQTSLNQLTLRTGVAGNKIDISAPTIGGNRVYTLPDVGVDAQFVMNSGTQTIGGTKNFTTRPTVGGTGVLLQGEAGGGGGGDATLGTAQTFTAEKTFSNGLVLQKSSNPLLTFRTGAVGTSTLDINVPTIAANRTLTIPDVGSSAAFVLNTGNQAIGGVKNFTTRPTVGGIGVLLEGEALGGGGNITSILTLTQSQYDAIPSPSSTTLYLITG